MTLRAVEMTETKDAPLDLNRSEAATRGVLRNFVKLTGKHLCQSLFSNKLQVSGLQLYQKRNFSTGVSCEFCEISKNTFFYKTPLVAASESPLSSL